MRGSWWHGDRYQWNRECRDEGWNKGNRDKWRGVGDVTEIGWTWGWKWYSRGRQSGTDLSEIHWWSISNNSRGPKQSGSCLTNFCFQLTTFMRGSCSTSIIHSMLILSSWSLGGNFHPLPHWCLLLPFHVSLTESPSESSNESISFCLLREWSLVVTVAIAGTCAGMRERTAGRGEVSCYSPLVFSETICDEGFDTIPGACAGILIWSFGGCTVMLLLAYQSQCPV